MASHRRVNEYQKEMSKSNSEIQVKLTQMNNEYQKKMTKFNSEIQVKLTQINNEHQKEMSKLVVNNKMAELVLQFYNSASNSNGLSSRD
ncbi:hypothetical protein C1645_812691 [Glomus cerebriforme]|uniref:Uncharacterized protein n=1 Tax=Glomus cerebriforme TaxID=658196 RepID=A0A397TPQ0_9GLOM|nr:hypothetical protein C1645_812691 [Glomus cerebriforme]